MIEEHLLFAKDVYEQRKLSIGYDLKHGIEGLTAAMEYFSIQGHSESFPLSVSVLPLGSHSNRRYTLTRNADSAMWACH